MIKARLLYTPNSQNFSTFNLTKQDLLKEKCIRNIKIILQTVQQNLLFQRFSTDSQLGQHTDGAKHLKTTFSSTLIILC